MELSAGIKVRARGLLWEVVSIDPSGPQQRLRLRCAAGDLAGLEWDALSPFETIEPADIPLRLDAPGTLLQWRAYHLAQLLDQCFGGGTFLATVPGRLQVEPYQLVPVLRALELPRPRLLLADGVGLGKTVQAGLIASELIARRRTHRVIVVAPAGPLLRQWEAELRVRFGMRPTVIADAADLRAARRRLPLGGNPFDSLPLCLTSLDFAKQDHVLEELERSGWDLAIIDEAHHCFGSPVMVDHEDTQRRRLAGVIASRADGLLLLSATPHDGNDRHFASLIGLLDPSLVDGQGRLLGQSYRRHVIRRLKAHVRDPVTGQPLFRERLMHPVAIALDGAGSGSVRAFHQSLSDLIIPRLRRKARAGGQTDSLAFVGLLKRSVSTVRACVATLRVVADRYASLSRLEDAEARRRARNRALRRYRKRVTQYGVLSPAEERDQATLEAEGMAAALEADSDVDTCLRALITQGEAAAGDDPKLDSLVREIRAVRAGQPDANILVYTEYADSQDAAVSRLRAEAGIAGAVLAISGRDSDRARGQAVERFEQENRLILVSTDSLAEGLNLQRRCHHLIHLDLPYNPNRLEQRNGRIDRYGQHRDPVIRYLYLAGTFEERLLLRLIVKYEQARSTLAVMPNTLGVTADAGACATALVRGFAEEQVPLFPPAPSPIRTLARMAEQEDAADWHLLSREINRAFDGFARMAVRHGWLSGHGINAGPRTIARVTAARQAGIAALAGIDPASFVTLAARAGGGQVDGDRVTLPKAWLSDAPPHDGDATAGSITFTRDPDDPCGTFLGWSHPIVRRAIAAVRQLGMGDAGDARVAACATDPNQPPRLLCIYVIERNGPIPFRRLIAVVLDRHGHTSALTEPRDWLSLGDRADIPNDPSTLWTRHFASWANERPPAAYQAAREAMVPIIAEADAEAAAILERDSAMMKRWLATRANEICGPRAPAEPDLFGFVPERPAWVSATDPRERLAAVAADAANPPAARQDARFVLDHDTAHRSRSTASYPPVLSPVGLLMLVPDRP